MILIFFVQEAHTLDDEALAKGFQMIKHEATDETTKTAFSRVQCEIQELIRNCSDNVKVVIYIDHVRDDPLIFMVGPGDNKLIITIRKSGSITYAWPKETMSKLFWDGVGGISELVANILSALLLFYNPTVAMVLSVGMNRHKSKAIEYK